MATEQIATLLTQAPPDAPSGYRGAPFLGVLVERLLQLGHEVGVFTTDEGLFDRGASGPLTLRGERFSITYCPVRPRGFRFQRGRPGRMLDLFRLERRHLADAMERYAPDVVHAHWTYEFAWAAQSTRLPLLITAHDDPAAVLRLTRDVYRLGRYWMARHVLRRARALSVVSGGLQADLRPLTSAPMTVVANPLAPGMFRANEAFARERAPGQPHFVMAMAGWSKMKNARPALRAFAQSRRDRPGLRMTCFGRDYGPGEAAERWVRAEGLDAGIAFVGMRPHADVLEALARATALVHPSLLESSGMAIAEAMACGLPVIAGRETHGVSWLLDDGKAGMLVDVRNPADIADAMRQLADDAPLAARLGRYGAARARELFDANAVACRYVELYERVIASQAPLCRAVARQPSRTT
ncbi:MAG: glycosyltransferase family 4 protein [Proteobacteria bacterium]|nr:glycosyltransferase family 4 protein [Pseudomonadota bacterium]